MNTATNRRVTAGFALLAAGVLMLATGLWTGSDPLASDARRLLLGGAFSVGGIAGLVAAFRCMRLDETPRDPAAKQDSHLTS